MYCVFFRLFSDVTFGLMDKPQFKVPSKLKESVRAARDAMEQRLREEQKLVNNQHASSLAAYTYFHAYIHLRFKHSVLDT